MRNPSVLRQWLPIAAIVALAVLSGGCETTTHSLDRSAYIAPPAPEAFQNTAQPAAASGQIEEVRANNADDPALMPGAAANRAGRKRQMVYSARFEISTPNPEEAMTRFTLSVENSGGYLESREDSHVVCRVPAEQFDAFVATMPTFGSIVTQAIRNEDVTRKYRDLTLHIETAEWSRQRVLALLERAEKLEDIIKLEEELLKLTAAIEGLKGTLADLSEQIAYSRVEVFFQSRASVSKVGRPDAHSPFAWINRVGVEQVTGGFGSVEAADKPGVLSPSALLPGGISVGPLEGFLVVKKDRAELKAITPDASKLWVREFEAPSQGNLDFWAKALKDDLVNHRGYQLIAQRRVKDTKDNEGVELAFDVVVQGTAHRYLVTVYVLDTPFWQSASTVRTIEFAAPAETFDKYVAGVRQACGSGLRADRLPGRSGGES